MSSMMIESAMMSNIRRIHRHLEHKELGNIQVVSAWKEGELSSFIKMKYRYLSL